MTETDFWGELEFRVCREFDGMEENALRFLGCDGFIPEEYLVDDPAPRITGRAWICTGSLRQDQWEFDLVLDDSVRAREDVPWEELLPSENVTGWLAVDSDGRWIRIDPSVAVPDQPRVKSSDDGGGPVKQTFDGRICLC